MDTNSVHKPGLPGVHTYNDDLKENASKKTFGGILFTTPVATLETAQTKKKEPPHSIQSDTKKLFDVGRAFDENSTQEGTIVTDKKREQRSVGKLLKAAFTEWWGTTQDSVMDVTDKMDFLKSKETPTVIAPKERTNTILEAAQHAKQAPRDDHKVVLEKIRTFAHDAESITGKPFTVKEDRPQAPIWIKEAQEKKVEREEAEKPPVKVHSQSTLDLRTSVVAPDVTIHSSVSLASYGKIEDKKKISYVPGARVPAAAQKLSFKAPPKKVSSWTFFKETGDAKNTARTTIEPTAVAESRPPISRIQFEPRSETAVIAEQKKETSLPIPTVATPLPSETTRRPVVYMEKTVQTVTHETKTPTPTFKAVETPLAPKVPIRPQANVSLTPVNFEYEESREPQTTTAHFEAVSPKILLPRQEEPSKRPVLKIALITGIVLTGSALGMFAAFFLKSPFPETEVPAPVLTIPTFLNTDAQIAVTLTPTRESFFSTLRDLMSASQEGIVQYYPVTPIEATVATTGIIMETLSPRTSGSFIRALSPYSMFGFTSTDTGKEPYIILQSQNFDVVFAGMLAWEPSISADLAPLFGTPVTKTLLPDGTKTAARFTDALRSNRSIRILYDETGTERIVYAFMNKNLILITTTTESLTKLIERIR